MDRRRHDGLPVVAADEPPAAPAPRQTLDVEGKPVSDVTAPTMAGSKWPLTPREVPQTVTSPARRRIEDQKPGTLDQALRQTPGVMIEPIDNNRIRALPRPESVFDHDPTNAHFY